LHRSTRNAQQKARLLDESFAGVSIDPVLARLSDTSIEPGYVGRPTEKVKNMIERVQQELSTIAPSAYDKKKRFAHG
jgi:vesicle-fusing ATPase